VGGLDRGPPEQRGNLLVDCAVCGRGVDDDVAADEPRRVHVPEHHERVGQGRPRPASSVADRPGIRAGAHRPDADDAVVVDLDDAPSAGPDLRDVDERQLDRVAVALHQPAAQVDSRADLVLARPRREAVLEQRGLGGRAAHVERDEVGTIDEPPQTAARDDAGGRAGLDQVRRLARRGRGWEGAAARLHDLERRLDPRVAQTPRERVDVAPDGRPEVGVDDRGARALVLAHLGEDVGRPGHEDVRADARAHELFDAALVRVIGVGVEERDRDRLDVVRAELGDSLRHRGLVELAPYLAPRAEALAHLEAERTRDERLRLLVLEVVEDGDAQAPELEDVAESLRRHERDPGAAALEDRIRRDGARVHDAGDRVERDAGVASQADDPVQDALRVVGRSGEDLRRGQAPVRAEQDDVRERASDVDPEAVRRHGVMMSHITSESRMSADRSPVGFANALLTAAP
jgi:hypothetical protein